MINFKKGAGDNTLSFPITQAAIDALLPSDLVNPFAMDDPEVLINTPLVDIPEVGSDKFELELVNVARMAHMAKNRVRFDTIASHEWEDLTHSLSGPYIAKCLRQRTVANEEYVINYGIQNARQLADLVHADYPTQIVDDLFRALKTDGAKIDKSLFPEVPYKVFTKGVVAIEAIIGMMVRKVSPTAFAHKYYHGYPRPEEIIGAWARGEFEVSDLCNETLEHYVNKEEVLEDQRKFTIYPEGSPTHPSMPAMHSALSAMALIFPVILDLSPEQVQECKTTAANVSFGRSFAGVHYRIDNLYGLELGERCAEILLPQLMQELMGADPAAVSAKMAGFRTNWLAEYE